MTDDVLLNRAAEGDEAAFLLLYERHRDLILRFSYRLIGSIGAAEDVTHDTFLQVIRDPHRFDPARASFRTYLCAIARHLALTRRRQRPVPAPTGPPDAACTDRGPLDHLISAERARHVRRAVLDLPVPQREVVILFDFEGLSLAETAAVIGTTVGSVKARLHRARERLRRALAAYVDRSAAHSSRRKSSHET